jgi:acetoin utilization protein AcuC
MKKATSTNPIIIHNDIYKNWAFSENSPTQGRRFTNAFDLIKAENPDIEVRDTRPATFDELCLVHDPAYIERVVLQHTCEQWVGERKDLSLLAQMLAGGTITALYSLLDGETTTAIHLPGAKHHAQFGHSSGFCVFADFAIAAKLATNLGLRVAIFDFDAHHGDGTENLCADDPNILTFSVHEANIFPWTGFADDPERHVYNEALAARSDGADLANATSRFITLTKEFNTDLIFIAGGADGHS